MSETAPDVLALVAAGDAEALKAALAAGADAEARDRWGVTALMRAAALGNLEMVELLLAHGAEAARPSDVGNTALMAAAARGHIEVAARLLDAGTDPAHGNKWGLGAHDWAKWPANSAEVLAVLGARET